MGKPEAPEVIIINHFCDKAKNFSVSISASSDFPPWP
jgi:hypothetical protein